MQYSIKKNKTPRTKNTSTRRLGRAVTPHYGLTKAAQQRRLKRSWTRKLLPAIAAVIVLTGASLYAHNALQAKDVAERGLDAVAELARLPAVNTVPPSKPTAVTKPFGMALGDTAVWLTPDQLDKEMATMSSWGVGWVRVDVSWADVQPNSALQYDWSGLDRVVAAANKYHLKVLGTLAYAPAWAEQQPCQADQKCPPAHDSQFAAFAALAVKRYSSQGVHDWEVWNEPNLQGFWEPAPDPLAYTRLLVATAVSIRLADPTATVISGGLGPLDGNAKSISQTTFLSGMYQHGAKAYFDALGYHPYSYPAPPSLSLDWSGWSSMSDTATNIRSIMAAHGDSKKPLWVTEYGAPTGGPRNEATPDNLDLADGPDHVGEDLQADMLSQATTEYESTPWMENFFWYSYQDLGTSAATNENFFGLLRYDGTPKPAVATLRQILGTQ